MSSLNTLAVNEAGTELSFMDSGAPSKPSYVTVFAFHGMCFASPIFQKVQRIAVSQGVRFVSVNRRNFPGSSPYTPDEVNVLKTGSDQQKHAWLTDRGVEVAVFIDSFIQRYNLPPISSDGKSGGVVLLGWSLGVSFCMAALAAVDRLSSDARRRFGSSVRSLIAHEPAPLALGLPTPKKNWTPLQDTTIPEELRWRAFAMWITSYFDHGDLSKRDLNLLSYVLPSTKRVPSIFNIVENSDESLVCDGADALVDIPIIRNLQGQLLAHYRKAMFDPTTAKSFPKIKTTFLIGEHTNSFGPAGMWAVQDDENAQGKTGIEFKMMQGVNHFVHWDFPETAVKYYLDSLNL